MGEKKSTTANQIIRRTSHDPSPQGHAAAAAHKATSTQQALQQQMPQIGLWSPINMNIQSCILPIISNYQGHVELVISVKGTYMEAAEVYA